MDFNKYVFKILDVAATVPNLPEVT